jgi:thioesterase domain-containing protein
VLAFEIARQLENNGDKIAKIILIDPNFQNKEAMKDLEQYWPLLKEKHTQYMLYYQSQCNHGVIIDCCIMRTSKGLIKLT